MPPEGAGQAGHDEQAQPRPAFAALGVPPIEPVEDVIGLLGAHPRAAVPNLEHGMVTLDRNAHFDRCARRGVGQGVPEQVVDHLLEPGVVARDGDLGRHGELDGTTGVDGPGIRNRIGSHRCQVDPVAAGRRALVLPGQDGQIAHQHTHTGRFLLDARQRPVPRRPVAEGILAQQLRVATDGGEGCAQFVGGIGQKAAQPVLGPGPFRECGLDLGQHAVEGPSQPGDLTVAVRELHPPGQVPRCDGVRGFGHVLQRTEAQSDQEGHQDQQGHQQPEAHRQFDVAEGIERGVHRVESGADHQCLSGERGGLEPVLLPARPGHSHGDRRRIGPIDLVRLGRVVEIRGRADRKRVREDRPRVGLGSGSRRLGHHHPTCRIDQFHVDVGAHPRLDRSSRDDEPALIGPGDEVGHLGTGGIELSVDPTEEIGVQ